MVADKGHHLERDHDGRQGPGAAQLRERAEPGPPEVEGKRDAQKAVYGNRWRIKGNREKRLLRRRGEKLERMFAHLLVSGGPRRVHVRGRDEIRKRILVHAAAFNLGLLMRTRFGFGTLRGPQDLAAAGAALADACARHFANVIGQIRRIIGLHGPGTGSHRPSGRFPHNETAFTRLRRSYSRRAGGTLLPRPAKGVRSLESLCGWLHRYRACQSWLRN